MFEDEVNADLNEPCFAPPPPVTFKVAEEESEKLEPVDPFVVG